MVSLRRFFFVFVLVRTSAFAFLGGEAWAGFVTDFFAAVIFAAGDLATSASAIASSLDGATNFLDDLGRFVVLVLFAGALGEATLASASCSTFRFFDAGGLLDGSSSRSESEPEDASLAAFNLASFLALYFAFITFCFARFALMADNFAFWIEPTIVVSRSAKIDRHAHAYLLFSAFRQLALALSRGFRLRLVRELRADEVAHICVCIHAHSSLSNSREPSRMRLRPQPEVSLVSDSASEYCRDSRRT